MKEEIDGKVVEHDFAQWKSRHTRLRKWDPKLADRDRMCKHLRCELDEQRRRCICKDCGLDLDAFDVLWSEAQHFEELAEWWEEYRKIFEKRREEMRQRREEYELKQEGRHRFYFERPPESAKVSCDLWDRIERETGAPPYSLSKSRKWVVLENGDRYDPEYYIRRKREERLKAENRLASIR